MLQRGHNYFGKLGSVAHRRSFIPNRRGNKLDEFGNPTPLLPSLLIPERQERGILAIIFDVAGCNIGSRENSCLFQISENARIHFLPLIGISHPTLQLKNLGFR